MEDLNQNQDQNQNPAPEQAPQPEEQLEGSRIRNDIPQQNGFLTFLRSSFVFILLALVIIGSFWVSFNLGKKLLVPVKKDIPKIEVAMPEPPVSIVDLQELEKAAEKEAAKKKAAVAKPKPKTARRTTYRRSYAAASGKYYKVQAGVFNSKSNALSLSKKLKTSGFETFIRKLSSGWRVQAGAYRSKKWAQKLQRSLRAKGFDSVLVYE
jgi:N-acetylmuramoyl-L-alanine amidase